MNQDFISYLFQKHQDIPKFPSTSSVCNFTTKTLLLLFPEQTKNRFKSIDELNLSLEDLRYELEFILIKMKEHLDDSPKAISTAFFKKLEPIYALLQTDLKAIMDGDPAAKTEYEIIRAYPGFYAIAFYRLAHELVQLNVPLLPRVITEFAHSKTGIDIHPGAKIGSYFFIDHGTGIVIGETVEIGSNVKLYQGVTLGALSVSKELASVKRHPTIENDVVIYAGATILGGETIIGANSIIGGNVWLTKSLPANSTVYHQAQIKVSNVDTL